MNLIEYNIYKFLEKVKEGTYIVPPELLQEFGEQTKAALKGQLERKSREFSLYMSNIGKPMCQLQMEKMYGPIRSEIIRNIFGDIVEDIVIFLIKASGIHVVAENQKVSFTTKKGNTINGKLDVILDFERTPSISSKWQDGPRVYDIKSTSDVAFKKYVAKGFQGLVEDDTFGYLKQLFLYAAASKTYPGGLIICNKVSGDIHVLEIPDDHLGYIDTAIARIDEVYETIDKPFKRCYKDYPELFRKQPTGNRILKSPCIFCSYKHQCWPGLVIKYNQSSTAKSPELRHYTYVSPQQKEEG